MLVVNFNAYHNYVTDSVYQWDINRRLNIKGLALSEAPEIHFSNANMERAIVRPSTLNNGTITVTIPNSLLQEPLPIKVYIGVYEDETFKIIEELRIPVIAKERPLDYSFVDDGEEIYSYNAIVAKNNEIINKMSAFEKTYEGIDFEAVRNYLAWVEKVSNLESNIEALSGTVLWTNPNPSEFFEAQTIELDLTEYKRFLLIIKDANGYMERTINKKGLEYVVYGEDTGHGYTRKFTMTDAGVVVGPRGSSVFTPYKIIGYKL